MSSAGTDLGVVVGVDGSPASESAITWAARQAALHKQKLTLVHVVPYVTAYTWYEVVAVDELQRKAVERGHKIVRTARDLAEKIGDGELAIGERVEEGHAVSVLIEMSKNATTVVVGTRGLGALGRAVLGSISSGLLHHAHCPVAVVHEPDGGTPTDVGPVVVGVDGSATSERAVAIAFDEASRREADLVAVHVWSDPTYYAFPDEDRLVIQPQADEVLAERLAGWQEKYPDVTVKRVVVGGQPAHQVVTHAESAQLIVVGSHGRGGFTGMLLGSVSSAVVQEARVPVIVARQ